MTFKAPIKIRLARFGRRHQPLYNIVVSNRSQARDRVPLEVLGTFNPVPIPLTPAEAAKGEKPYKHIELDFDRAKYWLGVGADVSDRVGFLFKRAGLLPEQWPNPNKLTQQVSKQVLREHDTVLEEPKELYRKR
ncbi:37S ribosomal protein S16, mitochondrial [Yamadazyma tenuis]|uniref:Ribosomal protein S16 n=1 Tax=Candida tenuis (strain ATCC 10573 / BCRC 21748 / CBS 615 / JCM 9827 / NBRC 10315 / NRRL Y-1498 / VKM Y-70) TaxID=590646 RepID=G3B4H6_CANTC|nr:ribosomal protein S16 [Yamadazyma tenuis ATCC 10573]EGV63831.1 ribosomal protein S16 [Yamadazyma tenuis ATCC 10573]WEJ96559.1 37S ribosomal protein S16, mitochondrial [Yamadazyma tenuis]